MSSIEPFEISHQSPLILLTPLSASFDSHCYKGNIRLTHYLCDPPAMHKEITELAVSSNSRPGRRGRATVIGGGPAGLMAAEVLTQARIEVDLFDAMPSAGRKLLLAGIGGLNLTHSEPDAQFLSRYGERQVEIRPLLREFGPAHLRQWAADLGIKTFVGSSGRVFPEQMKAAPLLRSWLRRLRERGVQFHMRHRWSGWSPNGALVFETGMGPVEFVPAGAIVLALGGASWAKLGSDGRWVELLRGQGVDIAPLKPANCGFNANWSPRFAERFAGHPIKPVVLSFTQGNGANWIQQGEFVLTSYGIEGSLVYAAAAHLRELVESSGAADISLDLAPGWPEAKLIQALSQHQGARSMANHWRTRIGLHGAKANLLREVLPRESLSDARMVAAFVKRLPLRLLSTRPIDEAISTAGGVRFEGLDEQLMLRQMPGVFCAGEMLDWEAPTGGYLLTASFASGRLAGKGAALWSSGNYGRAGSARETST